VIARCEYPATEIVMEGDVREHEILWVQILMPRGYVVVGALYHPPKPIYPTDGLLQQLESNVETIACDFPDSLIILAGDLNSLSDSEVVQATGLVPMIHQPTRGSSVQYVSAAECFAALSIIDLTAIYDIKDAQDAWDSFYVECNQRLKDIYPMRAVTMTSADPRSTRQDLNISCEGRIA